MLVFLSCVIFVTCLSILLIIVGSMFSMTGMIDEEKSSPFECGFIPQSNFRSPLSIHFFLIAILFIIFDVELIILFPFFLNSEFSVFKSSSMLLIILILFAGVIIEWSQNMLEWSE